MAHPSHVEQLLALARALYARGAIPEAMAIAREVFVSLLGREDLAQQLSDWIRRLEPRTTVTDPLSAGRALEHAIELLEPSLDAPGGVRALTNLFMMKPDAGGPFAERAIRTMLRQERGVARWAYLPTAFRSPAIGWEITSPVFAAARRQGLVVPEDFTRHMAERLPARTRGRLSLAEIDIVNAYARTLREQGEAEPGVRLATAAAVTSGTPVPVGQVIEIVRPSQRIKQAAELFDERGYPTEAVNVLVDSLEGQPASGPEWQQLWDRVQQGLARPLKRRTTRGPRRPPQSTETIVEPPEPPRHDPPAEKSFYFILKGRQSHRDQVVRGQPVDLYFLYGVPTTETLARLGSPSLGQLADQAAKGKSLEIGVFIKPVGFTLRGNDEEYKIACIENDELRKDVCFELQAEERPPDDTGFHAVLTYNGAEVFQGFVRIAIVDAIDATTPSVTQLVLSRSTFDLNETLPRDITAFITTDAEDGGCRVSVRVGRGLPKKAKTLNLHQLQNAILSARTTLATVAESPGFRSLTPLRWGPDTGQEDEFLDAVRRTMGAGSNLHKFLKGAEATEDLVTAIDALPDGAKVTIFTDSAFIPWEIIYPQLFFAGGRGVAPDDVFQEFKPERLWGNRFEFETVLVFANRKQNVQHPLPPVRRQPGTLNIRIGVGAVEPDPRPGTPPEEAALHPKSHHRAYCDRHPAVAHWLDGSRELARAFMEPDYDVSLLYLVCHGKSTGAVEELDFGGYKPLPEWVNPARAYPGWPVVFINSCSIAATGPHLFDTFLQRFREKRAFGLIASSFPLPTRFATLFGCEFLEGYRSGARVGELLLDLRKRLLAHGNPLGLFYALQCPLDVQRPERPTEP